MTPPSKVSRKWAKKQNTFSTKNQRKPLGWILGWILGWNSGKHFFNKKSKKTTWMNSWMNSWMKYWMNFFFSNLVYKLLSKFPTRQRKLEFSTTPPSKVSRKWAKKQNTFSTKSQKKTLGWILGWNPGWILFFLNLVWKLLSLFPRRQRKLEFSTTPPSKVLRKWAKKKTFWTKSERKVLVDAKVKKGPCWCKIQKKRLDQFLDKSLDEFCFF